MTTEEMIYEFELLLNTLDATLKKPKTSDTIDWLNLAQLEVIDKLYHEGGEAPVSELVSIEVLSDVTDDGTNVPLIANTQYFEMDPSWGPWRYILSAFCLITRNDVSTGTSYIKAERLDVELTQKLIETPYNKPWFRELYYWDSNEDPADTSVGYANQLLVVLKDSHTTITKLQLRFIREPVILSGTGDSDLHERYHKLIVETAVSKALRTLNPGKNIDPETE